MILCDREIEAAIADGRLIIIPTPDPRHYDSTTVDLCLADSLDKWVLPDPQPGLGINSLTFCPGKEGFKFADIERQYTRPIDISSSPHVLSNRPPDNFLLGWTKERIYLPHKSRLCARVEGKSSLARMGLGVHVTAPTIHSGFGFNPNNENDHGTPLWLEMWNVGPLPIELSKGMRICQLILEEVREAPRAGYSGPKNLQGPRPAPRS